MSAIDITEILDYLEEMNLTEQGIDHSFSNSVEHNFIETLVCPHSFNKSAVLYTLSLFYIFIFIIGLVANSVVVWVNLRAERNRYETHLYILNLAIADLCVVATLPIWVVSLIQHGHWPFGEVMCKITHLIFSVNLFGSIFFLTCMSVDRYISVVLFGDSNSRKKKVVRRLICIFVWLLALAASIPDTYYLKTTINLISEETSCRPAYPGHSFREWMVGIQLSFIVLGFAIPFPIIAIFYILLARVISSSSDQDRRISRKIIFTYIVVFLVCWLPYHAVLLIDALSLLNVLPFSCELENFLYVALHFTQCFSLIHCCVNPIIYNFINKNYRYDLMKAFIFKYSTKTGLAKLIDASKVSETEYSAVENNQPL
ncbi:atypical chemokine receptor 3-like [Acipenser oxyrinchus oxyrinchus]|uniref:Atypical chemokine receptor 3-like n=1 Tax=Acipenser oxyrinchus oxyrinchus TaxID=40147 RepID=A0AAD8G319_ACIOX|nr:atypical chemokine receptor 3-like [Acipenser oxyrinchus oxyrinchus]